jgi:hypothetical protein
MASERIDRLYALIPAIYRIRDHDLGEPLAALLRVIAEQVDVIEDDIAQLYENWFIETCEDWVVPYIGDLIGYQLVHDAGEPGTALTAESLALNRILIPQRDVADTIGFRRRKGTLKLLESLAVAVTGWPARAVEFYRLLGWTQNVDHLHLDRGRTVSLRENEQLAKIGGPFDCVAHWVDVRRIDSLRSRGYFNVPSVGLFAWRLHALGVTKAPAYSADDVGPECYTFSILGQDAALFQLPPKLPAAIPRWSFDAHKEHYYGLGKSIEVWAPGWSSYDPSKPVPVDAIVPTDLSDWVYRPPQDRVAVDPVLGRIAFPPSQLPKQRVVVSYCYGFSADIGGGEYSRPILQRKACSLKRVGTGQDFDRIGDAWSAAQKANEQDVVIEITDNRAYVEALLFDLADGQSLQLRAADRRRPTIRLIDWQTDQPSALTVGLRRGSRITFDGLLITGRNVAIRAGESVGDETNSNGKAYCLPEIIIRHCTFVPGWGIDHDCTPKRPAEPSLELYNVRARLQIEHSILGAIQINEDQVRTEPSEISISDSILDATSNQRKALSAPGHAFAYANATFLRCTIFGDVTVHAVSLAENCIFTSCLGVAKRQEGCMRFCYVPPNCRTPRRYHCQPDLVAKAVQDRLRGKPPAEITAAVAQERARVRPQVNSVRYGTPTYGQLSAICASEIVRGADDESEMGVFHDLFNPQRQANLAARLAEYSPAGMESGIVFVN